MSSIKSEAPADIIVSYVMIAWQPVAEVSFQ